MQNIEGIVRGLDRAGFGAWRAALLLGFAAAASAHDFRVGALVIDHPYATPTAPGAPDGAVYFRTLKNTGSQPDRLLAARSPRAASVQIRRHPSQAGARSAEVLPALDLPPHAELRLRHDGDTRLALVGLQAALQAGQCFPLWLRFERAGEREVTVCVQEPHDPAASHPH